MARLARIYAALRDDTEGMPVSPLTGMVAPVIVTSDMAAPVVPSAPSLVTPLGPSAPSSGPMAAVLSSPIHVVGSVELPQTHYNVVGVKLTQAGTSFDLPRVTIGGVVPSTDKPLNGPIKIEARSATITSMEVLTKAPGPLDNMDYFPINKTFRAGETFEVALPPNRAGTGLDQVEAMWTASYSVPDPSGRRSDEGKPFYLDGVYADLFIVTNGVETKIDRTKFVDANEVDNSHDLPGPKGDKLRVKFFSRNPAGDNHPITFQGVRFRYKNEAAVVHRQDINRTLAPNDKVEIDIPAAHAGKKVGRVEVRWTDMLSGTWTRPGYAQGTLLLDGQRVGNRESVQSPETQAFTGLNGATPRKVGVLIEADSARIDWIAVYFE